MHTKKITVIVDGEEKCKKIIGYFQKYKVEIPEACRAVALLLGCYGFSRYSEESKNHAECLRQAQMKVLEDKRLCEPPGSTQPLDLTSPI